MVDIKRNRSTSEINFGVLQSSCYQMSTIYDSVAKSPTSSSSDNKDSVDSTNIAIQIGGGAVEQQQHRSSTSSVSLCQSSIISWLWHSTTARYLAVLSIISVLIFLFERFLGTAAPPELRSAFVESLKEVLSQQQQQQEALASHNNLPRPLQVTATTNK